MKLLVFKATVELVREEQDQCKLKLKLAVLIVIRVLFLNKYSLDCCKPLIYRALKMLILIIFVGVLIALWRSGFS